MPEKPTLQQILERYSDIELTDDEILEAMIWAKQNKKERIRIADFKKKEEEIRKFKQMRWDFDVMRTYMMRRAHLLFNGKFELDTDNEKLFNLLCYYFIGDEMSFVSYAQEMGVKNPSINKGLLIPGVYGTGKTWMMKLFSRNNRQSFDIVRAKDIANEYLESKDKKIPKIYFRAFDTQDEENNRGYNNDEVFNQRLIGLCLDDLCSEEMKNNFGNKINVIGDIIETRYANGYTGVYLHGTTNKSADELKDFYGGRVASRMREIFNFIQLKGNDRRK